MKWWLKVGLALVVLVVIAFFGVAGFLGYSLTRVERVWVEESPTQFGLDYEDVSFPSIGDDLTLRGWYLPADDSQQIIIMVHGEGYHRADPSIGMMDIASGLVEHNYSVLTIDLRGHGESEGDKISAGYYETRDLLGAVEYAKGRGFEDIGVLGFSMGAVTSLLAAAENSDIDAVVSDSAFADLNDMVEPEFRKRTGFPVILLRPLLFMVKVMYGVDFLAIKPVSVVAGIAPRPIFFIHGEMDETIPVEHAYKLKEAAQAPKDQLWVVPQAGHVRAYVTHPEEYLDKVATFFGEVLR
jgi:fermentation-respiration switch protein FrsA (DUF1100 family)